MNLNIGDIVFYLEEGFACFGKVVDKQYQYNHWNDSTGPRDSVSIIWDHTEYSEVYLDPVSWVDRINVVNDEKYRTVLHLKYANIIYNDDTSKT